MKSLKKTANTLLFWGMVFMTLGLALGLKAIIQKAIEDAREE